MKTRNAYYLESIATFWNDLEKNKFEKRMKEGGKLSPSLENPEVVSWRENATVISKLLNMAKLPKPNEVYIAFEYAAPVGGRVDCMFFGKGNNGKKNVIIIELKQWGNQVEVYSAYGKNWVDVFVGGSNKSVDHPSDQAENYEIHFRNFIGLFDQEDYSLSSLAYCYNYDSKGKKEGLFDEMFSQQLQTTPLYTKDTTENLAQYLHDMLCDGEGETIAEALNNAKRKPTKALIDAAANLMMDPNDNTFVLLGEQNDAYKKFWGILKKTQQSKEKSVIIIKGGPGTGKTVIALKILSELYKEAQSHGKDCNAYYATRSTALVNQLAEALKENKGKNKKKGGAQDLIKKPFFFRPAKYEESEIDVLFVDEAHRVEEKSNDQTDANFKKETNAESVYCPLHQALSLIYCAKVTVFFIDDHQAVKNREIGNSNVIEILAKNYQEEYNKQIEAYKEEYYNKIKPEAEKTIKQLTEESVTNPEKVKSKKYKDAERALTRIKGLEHMTTEPLPKVNVYTYELTTQFRCVGADRFVKWVDYVLFNEKDNEEIMKLDQEDFDFQIIDTPQELEQKIRNLNLQDSEPKQTARLIAGWCWDWKDKTDENGDLKKEVQIGDWAMPWETPKNIKLSKENKKKYARSADFWAKDPQGINQVGCIYSAQGFEFDYVGVILGPDIQYDSERDCLFCVPSLNKERNLNDKNPNAKLLIRNIYKVLLTRGRKGCYLYSCDPGVSRYFKRFMNY